MKENQIAIVAEKITHRKLIKFTCLRSRTRDTPFFRSPEALNRIFINLKIKICFNCRREHDREREKERDKTHSDKCAMLGLCFIYRVLLVTLLTKNNTQKKFKICEIVFSTDASRHCQRDYAENACNLRLKMWK